MDGSIPTGSMPSGLATVYRELWVDVVWLVSG